MEELGGLLKKAREERNISINDISEQTKIQLHYLEALEKGDFSKFPGEVYLKGALRNYAELVGLLPEKVLHLYRELKAEDEPEEPLLEPVKKPPLKPKKIGRESSPSFIYGLIVLLFLLAAGGYWFSTHFIPKTAPEKDPLEDQAGPSGPDPGEAPGGEKQDSDEKEPAELTADIRVLTAQSTTGETVFSVGNSKELKLKLLCTGRCWIKVQLDDSAHFQERSLAQGEEIVFDASEKLWIRLGNPQGVELTVNGIAVKEVTKEKNAHNFLFLCK